MNTYSFNKLLHLDTNRERTCDDKSTRLHFTAAAVVAFTAAPLVAAPEIRSFEIVASTISWSLFCMLVSACANATSCFCLSASPAVAFVLRFSTTCTSPVKKSETGPESWRRRTT